MNKNDAGKYRLYLTLPEKIRKNERHYIITPDYCLVYTNKPMRKEGTEEITDFSILPSEAWEWLVSRINTIRADYIAENKNAVLLEAERFGEEFLKLATEKDKTKEEKGANG